jgi:serine/threonine-protein kinase
MLEVLTDVLAPGAVVRGYRLERVIGEGGMGVVWEATQVAAERKVALKFLRGVADRDAKGRERFLREARAAMTIAHPNVAKVDAVLETESGAAFYVMELLEGETLRQRLRRATPEVAESARIMGAVVDAIAAAHACGIVHRDLKPENVFLVGGVDVRVLDFGIAKVLPVGDATAAASLTSTGAVMGTPVYMAPEQLFGDKDIDGRADVWALGVMLYECLAGRRPIEGEGFGPIMKKITSEPIAPLSDARPGLPRSVTSLVHRMLTRDRAARPALVEVREVLSALAEGRQQSTIADAIPRTERIPATLADEHASTRTQGGTAMMAPITARATPPPPTPARASASTAASASAPTPAPAPALAPRLAPAAAPAAAIDAAAVKRSGRTSLIIAIVGLVLFPLVPLAFIAVVVGIRTLALSLRSRALMPGTAIAAIAIGLPVVLFDAVLYYALAEVYFVDRPAAKAHYAELQKELGDAAAAPTLDHRTACVLVQMYMAHESVQTNGMNEDVSCRGELSFPTTTTAQLTGVDFYKSGDFDSKTACLRYDGRWHVTEMRDGDCPRPQ